MFSKKTISLFILSLVGFIDIMGMGLVYPMFASMIFQGDCMLLPADASDGTRGACLGILLAAMPITQFFSAPILGMLSDQKGRKRIVTPGLSMAVVGYMVAMAAVSMESFALLLLSRILIGIAAGTASVVSAGIADISSPEDKAKNFGFYNMACGLGFTIGPFLGGILSSSSLWIIERYALPFFFAGVVTVINLLLVVFFLEDSYQPKAAGKLSLSLGVQNIKKAFQIKGLQAVFASVFLACVGWSFYWEFAPVTWISEYNFSTATIGNFYAYGAAVYALSCGVLIRPIVSRFSNLHVLCVALIGCSTTIGLLLFHASDFWLWVYIPLQQFFIALFWPTAAAVVSNAVNEDVQGEILGVLQSVDSLAFAVSPLIAGPLLGISTSMPIIVGSASMLLAAGALGFVLKSFKAQKVLAVDPSHSH